MTNVEIINTEVVENDELREKIEEYLKSLDFDTFNVTPDLINVE